MASRRVFSFSGWRAATANSSCPQFQDGLQQLLGFLIARHASSSAVLIEDKNLEKAPVTLEKWVELPPVPKAVPMRPTWGEKLSEADGSYEEDEKHEIEFGAHELTAVRWVAKCCPSVPNSLIQKLFRLRQIRQRTPQKNDGLTHLQLPNDRVDVQNKGGGLRRDSQILVINKPPGLPVQGGSDVRRSLDSLMGNALRYDYSDGPKLVHRLDKETSGAMVLARTEESATFLHALFRNKTASASASSRTDDVTSSIGRSYMALVMGTPRKQQGRISASLIKMVVDKGNSEKILVADDESSAGAQVAITDYKVVGSSNYGCTWLELRPLTGRKHQLRVHCAEVLGTPVVGDFKYGWKSHRSWSEHHLLQNPDTWSLAEGFIVEGLNNSEAIGNLKKVKGSVMSKDPMLHLHCHELTIPDPARLLEMGRSQIDENDWAQNLRFVAPLPPHMAVSKSVLSVV
ncbi:hypothetical protein AXG93_2145s1810 [Marchantia polymorpha subsp. ruderalis]|uniref:Pseudouridine synthase RsuA/RluA-like domain-containing protein n=1 Tax=Marchantia polymorpha subsp. ruderalis TaxID=1480154 RepID=A0A176W029_MARPO|nr:hypothetical protein AXG93_2145s1810 [Marchantia polymorpha subsp. ruderalis]